MGAYFPGSKGWVYFITWADDAPVKIGFSEDPARRLVDLQTANPFKLYVAGVVLGAYEDESKYHKRFRSSHLRGEWFKRGPKLDATIEAAEKEWWKINDGDYLVCRPVVRREVGKESGPLGRYIVRDQDGGFYFKSQSKEVAETFCSVMAGRTQAQARVGAFALVRKGLT